MTENPFAQVNRPADPANKTEVEKKHTPVVSVEQEGELYKVTVDVGELPHASDIIHFTEWIELYDGKRFVSRVDLTGNVTFPRAVFYLKQKPENPVARARCNTHGEWEGK